MELIREKPGLNVGFIAFAGVATVIVVTTAVLGIRAYFQYEFLSERERKVVEPMNESLINSKAEQLAVINQTGWADKDQNLAKVPIDTAMQIYVEQQGD